MPVLKNVEEGLKLEEAEVQNSAYMTTIVTNGHGKAIVTNIGMGTRVGSIAKAIIEDEAPQTPIQRKLEEVRKNFRDSMFSYMLCNICNRCI